MEYRRTASAEFPNDNPGLHDGALWVVSRPCAPARLLLRAGVRSEPPPMPAESELELPDTGEDGMLDVDVELFEEPAAHEVVPPLEEPTAIEEPCSGAQPAGRFAVFVSALVQVAMDAGATRVAAGLPAFLERGTMTSAGLPPGVVEALVSRGFAEVHAGGLGASAAFAATSQAWRRVLSGESEDLSACGTTTLDSWAAELLAAGLGAPPGAVRELRRELRRQGVAAFGIIAQAA